MSSSDNAEPRLSGRHRRAAVRCRDSAGGGRRPGRPDRPVGWSADVRPIRAGAPVRRARRRNPPARLPGRAHPPDRGRDAGPTSTSMGGRCGGLLGGRRARGFASATGVVLGSGWPLTAFPRGDPPETVGCHCVRPAGLLREQRRPRAWANARALARRDRPLDARSAGRPHRPRRPRGAGRHPARWCRQPRVPPRSAGAHADLVAGLRMAQARLHPLGITAWQDATSERSRSPSTARRPRPAG